jgi:hypothetical protein
LLWLIQRTGGKLSARRLAEVRFVPLVATESRSQPATLALEEIRQELERLLHRPR